MIGEGVTKFYYYKGPAVILRTSCANGAVFGVAREIAQFQRSKVCGVVSC